MDFRSTLQAIIDRKTKVLVVGLGISGIEAAVFLRRVGIPVVAAERQSQDEYEKKNKFAARLSELKESGTELYFGIDGEGICPLLRGVELAVMSPGISHQSAIYGALTSNGLPLVSELELGVELSRILGGTEAVAVTGSNGKTTTVSFIDHALRVSGVESTLCGNIGTPVVAAIPSLEAKPAQRVLVVEASSYQLEACRVFRPKIGVVLNLSENHLERHGTLGRYLAAKANLLACQTASDHAVLNADDAYVWSLHPTCKGQVHRFGVFRPELRREDGCFFEYRPAEGIDRLYLYEDVIDLMKTRVLGRHNRYNLAAACLVLFHSGLSVQAIQSAVDSFVPLEHRIEPVQTKGRGRAINDSKSTTVASTVAAVATVVEQFPDTQLLLMVGGQAKAGSWTPLAQALQALGPRLKETICFGRDGTLISGYLEQGGIKTTVAETAANGIAGAVERVRPSDIILFSPGCASFDEFTDFECRGRFFKEKIREAL